MATWQLPTPLSREIALAAPGGGIELLGGLLNGDRSSGQVLRIALPAGQVRTDGTLAVAVHDSAGAVVQGRIFVYGGGATHEVASIQQAVRGGVATVAGALPAPRSDLVAATTSTRIVLLGGYDGANTLADVLASEDGVHFTVASTLPMPVRYPAVVVRGHGILVYGGDVNRHPIDVIQRVDLLTGKTTVVGHLAHPLSHEAAFTLGGAYWLVGGTTSGGSTSAAIYRSTDGVNFTATGRLPGPRSDAAAVVVDGVGYLLGGETRTRTSTVVVLRPRG